MGLFFEDWDPDRTFTSAGRTVTETDVMTFAGLTGDFSDLHTNEEVARTALFGRRVAHGALVFSLSIGLVVRLNLLEGTLLAFSGVEHLRFVKPVFIGDTIRVLKRVHQRREIDATRGVVVFQTSVVNQREEIVLVYHDKLLVARRGTAG